MVKEKLEVGKYYDYQGVRGYCYQNNKLVLETGVVVTVSTNKYKPDYVTCGSIDANGYMRTKVNGSFVFIHRLVATHFIDNPDNLPVVDHINENKADNSVENLRWVTLELNTSRTNIRDNRALNEAREVLKTAKEKELNAIAYINSVQAELQELEVRKAELEHLRCVVVKEVEDKVAPYMSKVEELLSIASGEVKRSERNKKGTIGNMVRSRKAMIEDVGNKIKVNGEVYLSVRAAARFIVEDMLKEDVILNIETVRKELKRVYTGSRGEGVMYSKYEITRV